MEFALYKVRNDLEEGSWGLRAMASKYDRIEARQIPGIESIQLLINRSTDQPPKWQEDLLAIATHADLKGLNNKTTAALVLIRHRGQRFILAYGTGWHAIDIDSIQQSFGLRVAANAIGPTELRGVSTNSLGRRGRTQKVSIDLGSLHALGIETNDDLVRQLRGKPPQDFANDVSGGDMLRLKLPDFSFADLANKLDEIQALEQSEEYKAHFQFLDYFVRVPHSNDALRTELREALTQSLFSDPSDIGFACPEIDENYPADYFRLRHGQHVEIQAEIDPEIISDLSNQWAVNDPFKDIQVEAISYDYEDAIREAPLISYTAGEVQLGARRFALCAGHWYELDADNLQAIQTRIDRIPEITQANLGLPDWTDEFSSEGDYNEKAAEGPNIALLDKQLFKTGRAGGGVEICDLLTASKELICVKKMERSSTLSHLFSQGYVSAQLLADNVLGYRDAVMQHLHSLDDQANFEHSSSWTVVYAIATRKPGPVAKSLFFFSKVNLDRSRALLEKAQVNLAIAKIELTKRATKRKRVGS